MRLYSRTNVFNDCTCSYLLVLVVFAFDVVTRPLKTLEPLLSTVVLYTSEDCDCVSGRMVVANDDMCYIFTRL